MKRYFIPIALITLWGFFGTSQSAQAADEGKAGSASVGAAAASNVGNVVLKALVVNPSEVAPQTAPVDLPLPREASKKDVVSMTEGLKIVYDSDQGVYKAMGDIVLSPAEQKTVQISIRDIWRVPEGEIQFQKGYVPTLLKLLETTKYVDTARQLSDSIQSRLDTILTTQNEPVATSKHIAIYRENLSLLTDIRKDVRFLEKLAADKMPLSKALLEAEGENAQVGTPTDEVKTITLRMLVRNPSTTEKASVPVDYYLPREVQEKDVIGPGGLDIRYDLGRGSVYLHKDEVALEPGESKVYEIVLRDIWRLDPTKIQELEIKAAGFAQGMDGTKFEKSTIKMAEEVDKLAKQILQNQSKPDKQTVDERIAIYMENLTLLSQMNSKVATMARVDAVNTASPTTSPESMGLEPSEEQAKMAVSETQGMRGPEILANTMFAGKSPEETTVWKMIFAILIFLGFISILFYVLWWIQVKTEKSMEDQDKS